jgi:hypothetical protein
VSRKAVQTRTNDVEGVTIARGDLVGLDALRPEALALFCFSDVRPLSGVAGFLDWRVCGAISRRLEAGIFGGERGESLLLPTRGRLGRQRVFLFGLGSQSQYDSSSLQHVCREAYEVMQRAGCARPVFAAPHAPGRAGLEMEFARVVAAALPHQIERLLVEKRQ